MAQPLRLRADSVEKVGRRDRASCRAAADAISELGCGGPCRAARTRRGAPQI